ncbi:MAG: hypothetical protein ACHQJ7_03630 [Vicinamibacteria bacterium]|jgi:hypothetical protein
MPRPAVPWASIRRATLAACAAALLLAGGAFAAPVDEPGSPGRAYLDLRTAVEKAASPDAMLAYLSANYRRVVSNLPKAERDAWLARMKRVPPPPVKIQAQALAGDRAALGAVVRDASHVKWSGRVEMVREGGAWKLADETWTTESR